MDEDMEFSKPYQHGILRLFILLFFFLSISYAAYILTFPLHDRNHVDSRVWKHTVYHHYMSQQQVLPKARSFMWRVAHGCLPTRTPLAQKGIPCEDTKREISNLL